MNYTEPSREAKGTSRQSRWRKMTTSGWFAPLLVALVCGGLVVAALESGHGRLHELTNAVMPAAPAPPASVKGPGGLAPIRLSRTATSNGAEPEFLSAMLLPGRGMQILQITASIPGHGEVPLLFAPSVPEATGVLTGSGQDAHGAMSVSMGAAFMAPWAGQLGGTSGPNATGTLQNFWNGQRIVAPTDPADSTNSVPGMLLDKAADSVKTSVQPDGQSLEAVFAAHNFSPGWPATVELTLDVALAGKTLDVSIHAKNNGSVAIPFGAGWHPIFSIPDNNRAEAQLSMPSNTVSEDDPDTGRPTGKTNWLTATPRDFMRALGTPLGSTDVDETYVNLIHGLAGATPVAELRVPGYNYGLQVIPQTANITRMHVTAPLGKNWVAIDPDTNSDDPFGNQWGSLQKSGMSVLQPGETFEWKVRLQLVPLTTSAPAAQTP